MEGQNKGKGVHVVGGSIWGCGQPFIIYHKIQSGKIQPWGVNAYLMKETLHIYM